MVFPLVFPMFDLCNVIAILVKMVLKKNGSILQKCDVSRKLTDCFFVQRQRVEGYVAINSVVSYM